MPSTALSAPGRSFAAPISYVLVAIVIAIGWSIRDLRLVTASEGAGYVLGIVGASMMVLLLYPLRKRARWLRSAGAVRHWFRIHMILGIAGPVLVLFHSNFMLGSINSQVALFCTIVVAASGIVGRYLYAKIHAGLYGQRTTFDGIQQAVRESRISDSIPPDVLALINQRLEPLEESVSKADNRIGAALGGAYAVTLRLARLRVTLRSEVRRLAIGAAANGAGQRAMSHSLGFLSYRLSVLRKFAQLRACERLFGLWHVVHYPLFMVLVIAATVHVIAVHMY